MADKLTLDQFKSKIKEARAMADGDKSITENDIPAPEGFVDTAKNDREIGPAKGIAHFIAGFAADSVEEAKDKPEVIEEAPEAEVVASIDLVPESDPVKEPEEPKKEPEVTDTDNKIIYGRIDDNRPRTKIVGMVSRTLKNICQCLDTTASVNGVDGHAVFDGVIPKGKKGGVAIWEEGGAVYGNGSALIVTTSDGGKPQAYRAFHDRDIFNGRHALVPVDVGSYILISYNTPQQDTILIYRVVSIVVKGEQVDIGAELIATMCGDDAATFYSNATDKEKEIFNSESAAIAAAYTQATTHLSVKPAYINDYSPAHLDEADYWDAIADSEYRATLVKYDTLSDAYDAAGEYLAKAVDECGRKDDPLLITTIDIPDGHEDVVRVFISGVIYTKYDHGATKRGSSKGKRGFYARVILDSDSLLYYADRDPEHHGVTVQRALQILNSKKDDKGARIPMVTTLKRMTGAQDK